MGVGQQIWATSGCEYDGACLDFFREIHLQRPLFVCPQGVISLTAALKMGRSLKYIILLSSGLRDRNVYKYIRRRYK